VVYDNRLLIYLLGKAEKWLEPVPEAEAVAADWDAWAEAVELGLPEPEREPEPVPVRDPADEFNGSEVWQDEDGAWWTDFPPPDDYDEEEEADEEGTPGACGYRRRLTAAEEAVIEADEEAEDAEYRAREGARPDRYFGFAPPLGEEEFFSSLEAETYETSAPSLPDEVAAKGG
jgi:hypothetical protein